MMMDNEAAYKVAQNKLRIPNPNFGHLNRIISQIISASTTSLRFECELNASLAEMVTNLKPSDRYRYACVSFSPLRAKTHADKENLSTSAIVSELFEDSNIMCDISEVKQNRYLAACILLRGVENVEKNPE